MAYITGGSSGIGLGIARVFYEAGMKVVIGYLDEQHIGDALKQFPATIRASMRSSITSWNGTPGNAAEEIEKKFGGLQVLVNNAGVGLQAPPARVRTRIGNGAWG